MNPCPKPRTELALRTSNLELVRDISGGDCDQA